MQLELHFQQKSPCPEVLASPEPAHPVPVPLKALPLNFIKNPRARRYILRVRPDGSVRVTIPRGGTKTFAHDFAQRHTAWIQKQLHNRRPKTPQTWTHGTQILFRGDPVELILEAAHNHIRFADQLIPLRAITSDLRPAVEHYLWRMAAKELPVRTLELAALHALSVGRVMVRNQRSRWGSCSAKATLSLNWRLIQTPASVRDYLIIHELMHLRQMNHSAKFWDLVQAACPAYADAERWLNRHNHLLR